MKEQSRSPLVTPISSLAWIEGRWLGSHNGEAVEEHWSGPAANSLMGMFRWLRDDKVFFFELLAIEAGESGLVMRIKHFHPGLRGWEEKDDCVALDLVAHTGQRTVWFRRGDKAPLWLIYERRGDNLQAWFEKPGEVTPEESRFNYTLR